MSKEFDDIKRKLDQSHKDLSKKDIILAKDLNEVNKGQDKLAKDIVDIKKQIMEIDYKVDLILETLNNFMFILSEEAEHEDYEDSGIEDWLPEDDYWNNHEDES